MSRIVLAGLLSFAKSLLDASICRGDELANILQAKTSLTIERQSLADTLTMLAAKVQKTHPSLAIQIQGTDLQLEGITRNQVIRDVRYEDRPLAEILTALAVLANPANRLKSPADPQQKLVWIIAADPDDAKRQVILFTTRAAAEKRGDELPAAFQSKK